MLGMRKDYAHKVTLSHSVPFTLLGTGLLWFGFNHRLRARGLVAITPPAGYVSPRAALLIGAIAAGPAGLRAR